MKASLEPGVSRVSRITVDRDRTISFMGDLKAKAAKLGDQMREIK